MVKVGLTATFSINFAIGLQMGQTIACVQTSPISFLDACTQASQNIVEKISPDMQHKNGSGVYTK